MKKREKTQNPQAEDPVMTVEDDTQRDDKALQPEVEGGRRQVNIYKKK